MITRELAQTLKEACNSTDCSECDFATGVYMEGPDYVYYFCELLNRKPRDWDIEKVRVKQTKESKLAEEKEARKKERAKRKREEAKKAKEEAEAEAAKPKKKRGRPRKDSK